MKSQEAQEQERRRELVVRSLEGAVALGALYRLSSHLVAKNGYLRNRGIEGEDIAHSVAVKVLQRAEQFRGESLFSTWVHRIAVNQSKDEADKVANRSEISEDPGSVLFSQPDADIDPANIVIAKEEKHQLADEIQQLSEDEKSVLLLFYVQGLKEKEIAEALRMPIGTVKSHKHRGLEKLRKIRVENSDLAD